MSVLLGVVALFVLGAPVAALATHRHHDHHHHRHHGSAARTERFGSAATSTSAAGDAGTIAALEAGVLTLKLRDGTLVKGSVGAATEIRCELADSARAADRDSASDEDSGDGEGHDGEAPAIQPGGSSGGSDDEAEDGRGEDAPAAGECGLASLSPGTIVREAELRVSPAGAMFESLELIA